METKVVRFTVRQLDAWNEGEFFGWTLNDAWKMGEFAVRAGANEKRAFLRFLHKKGITCKRGKCAVWTDGDNYELIDRKTGEPLFDAVANIW
jgi:hypothetical protein